jgi:ferredoxin
MSYTNFLIYYFTGTGNSLRAAGWMAEVARRRGIPAQVIPVEGAHPNTEIQGSGQLLGLVGPTHAFTAPWCLIRFTLSLPRGRGADAFTLSNRAGMRIGRSFVPGLEGTAAYLIAFILFLKGYRVRGAAGNDMPSNWTVIHPANHKETAAAIIARARPRVKEFTGALLDGRTAFRGFVFLFFGILLLPLSFAYLIMGRFFFAKLFFASGRCNGCGECARSCPIGAIQMKRLAGKDPRPYWTFLCESCTRCFNFCPRGAVEASYPLGALLIFIANIPLAALLLDLLAGWLEGAAGLKGGLVEWVITYPYKLLVIFAGYWLFTLMLRVPLLNRLATILTPTHYYARYKEEELTTKNTKNTKQK